MAAPETKLSVSADAAAKAQVELVRAIAAIPDNSTDILSTVKGKNPTNNAVKTLMLVDSKPATCRFTTRGPSEFPLLHPVFAYAQQKQDRQAESWRKLILLNDRKNPVRLRFKFSEPPIEWVSYIKRVRLSFQTTINEFEFTKGMHEIRITIPMAALHYALFKCRKAQCKHAAIPLCIRLLSTCVKNSPCSQVAIKLQTSHHNSKLPHRNWINCHSVISSHTTSPVIVDREVKHIALGTSSASADHTAFVMDTAYTQHTDTVLYRAPTWLGARHFEHMRFARTEQPMYESDETGRVLVEQPSDANVCPTMFSYYITTWIGKVDNGMSQAKMIQFTESTPEGKHYWKLSSEFADRIEEHVRKDTTFTRYAMNPSNGISLCWYRCDQRPWGDGMEKDSVFNASATVEMDVQVIPDGSHGTTV